MRNVRMGGRSRPFRDLVLQADHGKFIARQRRHQIRIEASTCILGQGRHILHQAPYSADGIPIRRCSHIEKSFPMLPVTPKDPDFRPLIYLFSSLNAVRGISGHGPGFMGPRIYVGPAVPRPGASGCRPTSKQFAHRGFFANLDISSTAEEILINTEIVFVASLLPLVGVLVLLERMI